MLRIMGSDPLRPSPPSVLSTPVAARRDAPKVVDPWATSCVDTISSSPSREVSVARPVETGIEPEPQKGLISRGLGVALAVLASLPIGGTLFAAIPSTVEAAPISQTVPQPQATPARLATPAMATPPATTPTRPTAPTPPPPSPAPTILTTQAAARRPQKGDYVAHGVNFSTLMTDAEFTDSGSLSVSQIQALFDKSGSFLATYFQDGRSAATIVADAAREHGVNPRVILATLEKENSLVSRPTKPAAWVLRSAMGYAYNDGGGTAGRSSTLASQIDKGTHLLRTLYERGQQSTMPAKMKVDYGRHTIRVNNAATYALMSYTPHTLDTQLNQVGGGNYLFGKVLQRVNGLVDAR